MSLYFKSYVDGKSKSKVKSLPCTLRKMLVKTTFSSSYVCSSFQFHCRVQHWVFTVQCYSYCKTCSVGKVRGLPPYHSIMYIHLLLSLGYIARNTLIFMSLAEFLFPSLTLFILKWLLDNIVHINEKKKKVKHIPPLSSFFSL